MEDIQTLGNYIPIDLKRKVSWSNSKIGTLESCPRKYYYNYYGSKKKTALTEPKKTELSLLSKLSNKYLFPGNVVHDTIKLYFQKSKKGDLWDLQKLIWLATTKVNDAIKFSIEKRNNVNSAYKFEPTLLKEIFFDEIEKDDLRKLLIENVKKSLNNFYNLVEFKDLIIGGKKESSIIEEFANFQLSEHVSVIGKIDIAFYSEDQKFIVADWKTGKNEEEETSLQLLVYALWAITMNDVKIEDVIIQKAFLNSGDLENLKFSNQELERAKLRIIQSAESIQQLDEYGINAKEDAFTPVLQEKVCSLCQFKTICYKN